ncbi:uncharacterized protein BX664DRAFT_324941 [Halteromyces radiatus]|uniref:uncharacterized protein n=1 Tax=Halteromyces radiatus TaxID=101107 RepID=UPI00221E6BE2|nr:uncharacterized protein BX664DRAFT_324941 [Halteromyces radiatus]KAI8096815.1 hypothetical protein BX664DRAFT_324941 [Halteromyces radiatus]
MTPNVTESSTLSEEELKNFDLKKLVLENGDYTIFPDVEYPPLVSFEHDDPGKRADPNMTSLFEKATKIEKLTPKLGTVIYGLQLSELTDQQKDDLSLLCALRGVVFFKKQNITPYQFVQLGKYFGPLHVHNAFGHPPHFPEISTIYYDRKSAVIQEKFRYYRSSDAWHSDISFEEQPGSLSFLKIDTLPSVGGDTTWADGYAAYDKLTPTMQRIVDGLEVEHTGEYHRQLAAAKGTKIRRPFIDHVHPLVRTHPLTGMKSLYLSPIFTSRIVGLSLHESEAILKLLNDHVIGGHDFQVRYKWEEDDVAVWDNRCCVHNAIVDYFDEGLRHGYRVTPQGERPFYDPSSKSRRQMEQEKAANGNN